MDTIEEEADSLDRVIVIETEEEEDGEKMGKKGRILNCIHDSDLHR